MFLGLELGVLLGFGALVFGTVVRGSYATLGLVAFLGAAAFAAVSLVVGARVENTDVANGWMVDHLGEFSSALAAFATDLGNAMGDVTLITLTEFGRRVEENGSGGTDHGFGQAVFLMGDGVKGGQIHGNWPGLAPQDLVDGDLDATTDYRNLLASVLEKRCGASVGDVTGIFPGIDNVRPDVVQQRAS